MLRSLSKNAIPQVLAFLGRHWKREWKAIAGIGFSVSVATVADLYLPVFSGKFVDAIMRQGIPQAQAFHSALGVIAAMVILGLAMIGGRHAAFIGVSRLTVRLMSRM